MGMDEEKQFSTFMRRKVKHILFFFYDGRGVYIST